MHTNAHNHLLNVSNTKYPEIYAVVKANGLLELETKEESDIFIFLARTVVGQQLSTKAARSIWQRIESLAASNNQSMQDLFQSDNTDSIRNCGISRNKIRAIRELNEAMRNDPSMCNRLLAGGYEQVINEITAIWGFGVWSADMCAIFYCGFSDVHPSGDVAVTQTLRRLCGGEVDISTVSAEFSPYQSYLSLHMWKALDDGYFN